MNALLSDPIELPANLRHEFDPWKAGFDAATELEKSGTMSVACPFFGNKKQSALWHSGFAASRRVTQLAEEI